MFHIKKVELTNIRRHKNFSIEFGNSTNSHLVIGKNGDGKTSVLRAMAMGLCNESDVAKLMGKNRSVITYGKKFGTILLSLIEKRDRTQYEIYTKIEKKDKNEKVSQSFKKNGRSIKSESFPWSKIFVASYGAMARTLATKNYNSYSIVEAVDCLFDYASSLQNPELTIRRVFPNGSIPRAMEKELNSILCLGKEDGIQLEKNGMFIRNGGMVEFDVIGDGRQSTLTWILDLLHWWILYKQESNEKVSSIKFKNIEGIVIVDEIENHLHPEWEKRIVSSLTSIFPKVQFIMSTHSPLVVSGAVSNTYNFHTEENTVSPINVHGWPAEYVFRDIMGLRDGTRTKDVNEALDKYDMLYLKNLNNRATKEDKKEIKKLEKFIKERTPSGETSLLLNKIGNMEKFLQEHKR